MRFETPRCVSALLAALAFCAPAAGQLVLVDHPPHNSGGPAADTLFINSMTGQQMSQQVADDFTLPSDAWAGSLSWHGFYGGFQQDHQPPAGDETMRVRFYEARSGDGLPGDVIYEESFLNPSRTWTGRNVLVALNVPEFLFEVTLSSPIPLRGGQRYWLEVVQAGILSSTFRWEYSLAGEAGFSAVYTGLSDWLFINSTGGLAFRLYEVPEPATC